MSDRVFTQLLTKGILALIMAAGIAVRLYNERDPDDRTDRYLRPVIDPLLLPMTFIALTGMLLLVTRSPSETVRPLSALAVEMLICLLVYYTALIPLHFLLRRYISARTCAALWMLPNFLFLLFNAGFRLSSPLWTITIKGRWPVASFYIWAAGFAAVMLWQTAVHLRYRHEVMKDAAPVTDLLTLEISEKAHIRLGYKKKRYRIFVSPAVSAPVSVGLIFTRIVLPEKAYDEKDLELILRHELIHIRRNDNHAKFFMAFCTAFCWFNPLMWTSVKRLGEDVELSCDEAVLRFSPETEKRRYAELILSNAGDERGFTTCLSARAEAMKNRLTRIVDPPGLMAGGIFAGAAFFILLMAGGTVAFGYGGESAGEILAGTELPPISSIRYYDGDDSIQALSWDRNALLDHIGGLQLYERTGLYTDEDSDNELIIIFEPEGDPVPGAEGRYTGVTFFRLTDTYLRIGNLSPGHAVTRYLDAAVDWDYISSLLDPDDLLEEMPVMKVSYALGGYFSRHTEPLIHSIDCGDHKITGDDLHISNDEYSGRFTHRGSAGEDLIIEFSYEPDSLTVTSAPVFEDTDPATYIGTGQVLDDADLLEDGLLHVHPYSAVYRLRGKWTSVSGYVYDAEFIITVVNAADEERWLARPH